MVRRMRVLIVSDTHKKNDNYFKALEQAKPVDLVIHCGDVEGSEYAVCKGADCPVEIVMGNNDFFSELPREMELKLGKYKALVTHGHTYYVSMGNELLKREARARGMNMVIYGHTHKPVVDFKDEVAALNPGSLSYPRQEGRRPSYILMDIDEAGEVQCSLHYL